MWVRKSERSKVNHIFWKRESNIIQHVYNCQAAYFCGDKNHLLHMPVFEKDFFYKKCFQKAPDQRADDKMHVCRFLYPPCILLSISDVMLLSVLTIIRNLTAAFCRWLLVNLGPGQLLWRWTRDLKMCQCWVSVMRWWLANSFPYFLLGWRHCSGCQSDSMCMKLSLHVSWSPGQLTYLGIDHFGFERHTCEGLSSLKAAMLFAIHFCSW